MRPATSAWLHIAAGKIEPPLDLEAGLGFDLLRKKLAEDDLFGKVLRTDDGVISARW